jgi:hypothetical protein
MFATRPFWLNMRVPLVKVKERYAFFFGTQDLTIDSADKSIEILKNVIDTIQNDFISKIKNTSPNEILFRLHYIFGEVYSLYLYEKEQRHELSILGSTNIIDTFEQNKNIMRNIIDACNIWIENCVLYQKESDDILKAKENGYKMDFDFLIDLYLYGMASRSLSLIALTKKFDKTYSFYGLEITPDMNIPAEVLKNHPIVYFNTSLVGNQDALTIQALSVNANITDFGKGFSKENRVEFLLFLAALKSFQETELRNDEKSLVVISKDRFFYYIERCTNPKIISQSFYESFVLNKEKLQSHLGKDTAIWKIGVNKYRYEIRPFIDLGNEYIFVSYAALEQAINLWCNFYSNGGMCYTTHKDELTNGIDLRNKELSTIVVDKLIEILNNHHAPYFCDKDVDYKRIFGIKTIDYGDYDIVYYVKESSELYLIEAKYFSDSFNSSGMKNDLDKMFGNGKYYEHCRKRYDLVITESEKIKNFIGAKGVLKVHFLFISSKPLELEFQDDDKVVTFLSLNIFDKYINGNLLSEDGENVMRPTLEI